MDNHNEIAVMEDQQYSPQQITLDDNLFNKCNRLAEMMAKALALCQSIYKVTSVIVLQLLANHYAGEWTHTQ